MTTYVYETILGQSGEQPKRYEIQQHMADNPLTMHPETGEPIRRIILGGLGVLMSTRAPQGARDTESDGCGPGCSCG